MSDSRFIWWVIGGAAALLFASLVLGRAEEADDDVIPPGTDGYPNARIVMDGEKYDACHLAAEFANEAQDLADQVERQLARKGPLPDHDLLVQLGKMQGAQEISVAICLGRPLVDQRLPPKWRGDLQRNRQPKTAL